MFVSKVLACATVLLASGTHSLADRTPCSHDITMGELGACVLREAKKLNPKLAGDNLTLEYLDPLSLGSYEIQTGNFIIKNKRSVMNGLSNTKMVDVIWDYDDNTAYITLEGNMVLTSDYESTGSILFVPLTTSGKLTVEAYDAKIIITHKFRKVVDETGLERLDAYSFSTTQEYGRMQFRVKTGNLIVDKIVSAVLNYNWRWLAPIGAAKVAGLIAESIGESFNHMVKSFSYDDITKIL